MGRPLRLEYPGAVYHLMSRGHERGAMFRDEQDHEQFPAFLGAVATHEGWEVARLRAGRGMAPVDSGGDELRGGSLFPKTVEQSVR